MTASPFFSIVIANLNHGSFLEEAICSVINQSCKDFELLIIDGGSQDESLEIIKTYEKYINWWCSEKDNGQSNAFNKGLKHSKGKYYTWLNADDLLLPDTLLRFKEKLNRNPECRWMTGNFIRFNHNYHITEVNWGPHVLPKFLQTPKAPIVVYGPSSIISRQLLVETGGFNESLTYCMDTELWIRFMNKGVSQIRLNHFCWGFRMHSGSKTAEFKGHLLKEKVRVSLNSEEKFIFQKYNYNQSEIIRVFHLIFRLLDGSLIYGLFKKAIMTRKSVFTISPQI